MKKLMPIRTFVTRQEMKDLRGWTIPKHTNIGVFKEIKRPESVGGGKILVIRIENGTGDWSLCPETAMIEN